MFRYIYFTLHTKKNKKVKLTTTILLLFSEYRGPPDPLRGEVPYQRVRNESKVNIHFLTKLNEFNKKITNFN